MTIATTASDIQYRAKPNSKIKADDVPRIAEELAQLATLHGDTLAPASVVGAASDPKSAMHAYFEWDDSAAAQEYRIDQARHLIRSIEVIVVTKPGPDPERAWARQYHHVRVSAPDEEPERRYVPIGIVSSRENMMEQVLANAQRELFGWRERVRTYQSLEEFRHLRDILRAIDELQERIRP